MADLGLVNLHTHTARCKHAVGNVFEYVHTAAKQGFRVLGITDHAPFPDHRIPNIRMDFSELDDYICEVREAQIVYPSIRVLLGL